MRAVVLVTAAIASGCGLLPAPDAGVQIEGLEIEPRRIQGTIADAAEGPLVELLRGSVAGDRLALVAQASADGLCLASWRGPHGSTACGHLPGDRPDWGPFGPVITTGPDAGPVFEILGAVSPRVDTVAIDLADGSRARAQVVSLEAAGIEGRAFVAYLADPQTHVLLALDAAGNELGRLEFQTRNPGP